MRTLAILLSIALYHVAPVAADDEFVSPRAASEDSRDVTDSKTVRSERGGVILDGLYIAGPYEIVQVEDGIEVNGYFVPEDGFNERSRRSRSDLPRVSFAERIRNRLDDGAWLLGWEEGEYGILGESRFDDVLCALTNESTVSGKIDELDGIGLEWITRSDWRQLLGRCELPESVRDRYRDESGPSADPALVASIGAPLRRFHTSIYLLTVFGIGATVFALGTLLSYRPVEKMPWSNVNLSKDAMQLVLRSVVLLIGLAVLDLICTTMSSRTASFWELNPLGAVVIQSPLILGTFKIGATLISGGILLALRRYHGAQVASWWLALFCTILAIRWVTYNSMFMA